jgi:DNA-binding transcriptional ArsR family regulator
LPDARRLGVESYHLGAPPHHEQEAAVPAKPKFTRIPKVRDLTEAGVPAEVIPTYCALTDYANNKTGLCWPKMETLAKTLGRSMRTVQRHLHLLRERGLIEFVERRRNRGRYSSYLYRVLHIMRTTTGHGGRVASILKGRTKPSLSTKPPQTQIHDRQEKRKREAQRRTEGFEWLFE